MGKECPSEKQHPNTSVINVGHEPNRQCKESVAPKEVDGKAAVRGPENQHKE